MLVAILRAPLLAALAVGLNLASVAAAIGVMSPDLQDPRRLPARRPPLHRHGRRGGDLRRHLRPLDRLRGLPARPDARALRRATATTRAAIDFGLEKTAGVITGAAAIMAAVFISFAAAPIATVSQMGVGLTVAILLDATVVRIVLLPALMLLLGDRVWHTPPGSTVSCRVKARPERNLRTLTYRQ